MEGALYALLHAQCATHRPRRPGSVSPGKTVRRHQAAESPATAQRGGFHDREDLCGSPSSSSRSHVGGCSPASVRVAHDREELGVPARVKVFAITWAGRRRDVGEWWLLTRNISFRCEPVIGGYSILPAGSKREIRLMMALTLMASALMA